MERLLAFSKLEELAKSSGFVERKSKIGLRPFLDMLFFETQSEPGSLRKYIQSLRLKHQIKVSKEGINRRFNSKLVDFLSELLGRALRLQYTEYEIASSWKNVFSGIRIMDSTEFKLPENMADQFPGYRGDGTASVAQIQFEYELLSNKITQLKIGHALESDRTEGQRHLDNIPSKTLILRDLGYYNLNVYRAILKRDIYFISRVHSQVILYEKINGTYVQITCSQLFQKLAHSPHLDMEVYVGKVEKIPMRMLAFKLDDAQYNRRLRRLNKRQAKTRSDYNRLNLFVTNVSNNICSPNELYALYKLRWQIEIIFKSWKSIFKIDIVHKMKTSRFQAILLVKMIWIILNHNLISLASHLHQRQISTMKFSSTFHNLMGLLRTHINQGTSSVFLWVLCCVEQSKYCLKEERNHRAKTSQILNISN